MKIDIAESAVYSWLRHIKGCKIVQLNWKKSPKWEDFHSEEVDSLVEKINKHFNHVFKQSAAKQIFCQAEIDALGVCFTEGNPFFYAVEVAFHEAGLNYDDSAERVCKKLLRIALILYFYFNTKEGEIIFATPKVCPKTLVQITEKLQKIIVFMQSNGFFYRFSFIGNERFEREIIQPLKDVSNEVADTAELFLRSYQFLDLLQKRESLPVRRSGVPRVEPNVSTIALLRRTGMRFFISYYDFFKKGCSPKKMLSIITEDYTNASKQHRCCTANRIFKEKRQIEALQLIAHAQDVPVTVRDKAISLLTQEQSFR